MKISINSIDSRKRLALRSQLVKKLLTILDKELPFMALTSLALVGVVQLLKYGCAVLEAHV
jgi:hypothetical protein